MELVVDELVDVDDVTVTPFVAMGVVDVVEDDEPAG